MSIKNSITIPIQIPIKIPITIKNKPNKKSHKTWIHQVPKIRKKEEGKRKINNNNKFEDVGKKGINK